MSKLASSLNKVIIIIIIIIIIITTTGKQGNFLRNVTPPSEKESRGKYFAPSGGDPLLCRNANRESQKLSPLSENGKNLTAVSRSLKPNQDTPTLKAVLHFHTSDHPTTPNYRTENKSIWRYQF